MNLEEIMYIFAYKELNLSFQYYSKFVNQPYVIPSLKRVFLIENNSKDLDLSYKTDLWDCFESRKPIL